MPVPMHSHNDVEDGELVRQTSAMNITEEPWLENTEKVYKMLATAFLIANNISLTRSRPSRKSVWGTVVFFTAANDSSFMVRVEPYPVSRPGLTQYQTLSFARTRTPRTSPPF